MRKIFFAILFSLLLLALVFQSIQAGEKSLAESPEVDFWDLPLPPAFDTNPSIWTNKPIEKIPGKMPHQKLKSQSPKTPILLIGFQGLNWDIVNHLIRSGKAPNLTALVASGVRANLKAGLDQYLTPENTWLRVLKEKQDPKDSDPFIWEKEKSKKRLALLDVPYAKPKNASQGLFFSLIGQGPDKANNLPTEDKLPLALDFAATKFKILKDHPFDLGIVSINQPDKTQHRALLGYTVNSMIDKKNLIVHKPFDAIFKKNKAELEAVYKDLDQLAAYLLTIYKDAVIVCFSVHGHKLTPYEIRVQYTPELWKKAWIEQATNETQTQNIYLSIDKMKIDGKQISKAKLLPVITNKNTGQQTNLCLSYFQWEFPLDLNPITKYLITRKVRKNLASIQIFDKPFFNIYTKEENLIVKPTENALKAIIADPKESFNYANLIAVTRVQSGHPQGSDGIFIATGPGIPQNKQIKDLYLKDVLPYALKQN